MDISQNRNYCKVKPTQSTEVLPHVSERVSSSGVSDDQTPAELRARIPPPLPHQQVEAP